MKVEPSPAVGSSVIANEAKQQHPASGISFNYFEGDWDSLPDFSTLNPLKTGTIKTVSLNPADQKEYYAFQFEGWIKIASSDVYAFYADSDDGSDLLIDGRQVVNNDGLHGMKETEGTIALEEYQD